MASVKYAEKRLLSVLTATPREEIGGKKSGGGEGRGGEDSVMYWCGGKEELSTDFLVSGLAH